MARVTVSLGFADLNLDLSFLLEWRDNINGLGLVTDLRLSGVMSWATTVTISDTSGASTLIFVDDSLPGSSGTEGEDLTVAWENYENALTFSCPGIPDDLILPGPNHSSNASVDESETYRWIPSSAKLLEVEVWLAAHRALPNAQRNATLTLDDGLSAHTVTASPANWIFDLPEAAATGQALTLADWTQPADTDNLVLALVQARVATPDFVSIAANPTDLLDGELVVANNFTLDMLERACDPTNPDAQNRWRQFQHLFRHVRDIPGRAALHTDQPHRRVGIHAQQQRRWVLELEPGRFGGHGCNQRHRDRRPADMGDHNSIDRYRIHGRRRPGVVGLQFTGIRRTRSRALAAGASPANWTFSLPEAAATRTGRTLATGANPVLWTFAIPEALATRAGRTLAVNASPASWIFDLPEAAAIRIGRNLAADATPALWAFNLPEASTIPAHAADPVLWTFALPEAVATRTGRTLAVDADPALWTFDLPQAAATRGRALATDANPALWTFSLPESFPATGGSHTANASPVLWTFDLSSRPGPARYLSATAPGGTVADLTWVAPLSDAFKAITHYEVAVIDPDGTVGTFEDTDGALGWRIRGLAIGHRYGFRVQAVSAANRISEASETVYAVPVRSGRTTAPPPGQPIPLNDVDRQSLIVRLAGRDCRIRVWWQPSDISWWASLEVPANTPAIQSRRLALNSGILDRVTGILPGNLVCRSLGGIGTDPARDAWREPTHALVWEPA